VSPRTTSTRCALLAGVVIAVAAQPVAAKDFLVTTTNDTADSNLDDGECFDADLACSLRAAVQQSGAFGGSNRVLLDQDVYLVELGPILLTADNDTTVVGATRAGSIVDGAFGSRLFDVEGAAMLTLQTLTLRHGRSGDGGAIRVRGLATLHLDDVTVQDCESTADGGAIRVTTGTVEIAHSTLLGNQANADGGAVRISDGTLTVTDSTIAGNESGSDGGGIRISMGELSVTRSTISGNMGGSDGGGIRVSDGTTSLENSTVTGNDAGSRGGGLRHSKGTVNILSSTITDNDAGRGGGISTDSATTTLTSSIVALNRDDDEIDVDCDTDTGLYQSGGANIDGDGSCGLMNTLDQPETDPLLFLLANRGGPTEVHALRPGSPALEAGINANCPLEDQRGFPRPVDYDLDLLASCDIGSVEMPEPAATAMGLIGVAVVAGLARVRQKSSSAAENTTPL
jgi:CSLREA domain-containing protein